MDADSETTERRMIMRPIDADAMMRIYQEVLCPHVSCVDCSLLMNDGNCRFETMIREAPTIDAVPIVRCRECKHCDPENYHCDHHMGTAAPLSRKPDDFCSYGERKEGAN